jgi:murein DD-endopeptidase MepM/ murein hydrolase activator NlpD
MRHLASGSMALLLFATFAGPGRAATDLPKPPPQPPPDLASKKLLFPIQGFDLARLRDTIEERRGMIKHEALDIMAQRGTPVLAVDDGRVAKLFRSLPGGITIYQFDASESYSYYYAHLDRYAPGLVDGALVKRGDVIGYVGSSGNASADAPHLHFAIFKLGTEKRWWKGEAINPFPYFVK